MSKCILITGMSGTGKSSVIIALRQQGYKAVDFDSYDWSHHRADGEWVWQDNKVRDLLENRDNDTPLFVSGCAINQGQFYPLVDKVVLLFAPVDVIVKRVKNRTTNDFGKDPDELAAILSDIEEIEPLLRKGADIEIDTSAPLDVVVSQLIKLLDE